MSNSAVFNPQLPSGWTAVSPLGHEGAATRLVAVRDLNTSDPVVTSLAVGIHTVAGRPNLALFAEAAVDNLRRSFAVTVLNSDAAERTDDMSEFNQLLEISYPVGNSMLELRQIRILIAVPAEAAGSGVLQLVMTTPVVTFPEAAREFREFVGTLASGPVHPRSADALDGDASAPVSQPGKD